MSKMPSVCPACESQLSVQRLYCNSCGTAVEGDFSVPVFLQLTLEEQAFVMRFLQASGSLKEMAGHLGYSYPKVRNMLDEVIGKVQLMEQQMRKGKDEH
ncbi:MAG TPA: hypothetical protein DDW81_02120 [Cryomorphaceae bacterium]|nr:hypothetical protein [Owenweeksia sp.]HBF18860.1 hypothetical protein [Cryomorphaceae bacterium]HCQ16995.1 hypothetical protein [Cryomorphaceae bacterium]